MDIRLTAKQQNVYDYVKQYIRLNNRSPYIREIQEGCGIQCYKSAVDKLLALEKKGFIKRELNKHRSISVVGALDGAGNRSFDSAEGARI